MFLRMQEGLKMLDLGSYDQVVRMRPDLRLTKKLYPFPRLKSFRAALQRNHLGFGIGDSMHYGKAEHFQPFFSIISSLPYLYEKNDSILCPHMLCEVALADNGIPVKDWKVSWELMHTPGGSYRVRSEANQWEPLVTAKYEKIRGRFVGECGVGSEDA
jgi:hypothetical protein